MHIMPIVYDDRLHAARVTPVFGGAGTTSGLVFFPSEQHLLSGFFYQACLFNE
jgi:hypothetical protein